MPIFSAGSASVSVVPDFSGAQKAITEFFAAQKDVHVAVKPDLSNADVVKTEAELNAMHGTAKVEVDKNHLSNSIADGIKLAMATSGLDKLGTLLTAGLKPAAFTALIGAATELGAALLPATGALALMPAAMLAIAAPAATVLVGIQGVGAAFKALDTGNAQQIAKAMADLAPSAQQFVTQVHALGPAFTALRLDVQQTLFAGLGTAVTNLAAVALPVARAGMSGLAATMNTELRSTINQLSQDTGQFTIIWSNINQAFSIGATILPELTRSFVTLATIGSQFLPQIATAVGNVVGQFAAWVAEAAKTGLLVTIIQNAINVLTELGKVAGNVISVVTAVFTAALPGGTLLLKLLVDVTGQLAIFAHSADGQTALRAFFDGITSAIGIVLPALENLVQAVVTAVLPAIGQLAALLAPIAATLLNQLATALRAVGAILPPVATVIAALVSAMAPLIPVISQLITTLLPPLVVVFGQLAPIISQVAQILGQALLSAAKAIAPVLPVIGAAFIAILQALLPLLPALLQIAVQLLPALLEVVRALVPIIQSAVTVFAAIAGAFLKLVDAAVLPVLVELLKAFADGLKVLSPILGPMAGIILAIAAAVVIFNLALDVGPIGLVVIAIGLLVAALGEVVTHWKAISDFLTGVWNSVVDFVIQHWQLLVAAIPGIGPVILAVVAVVQNFGTIWQAIVGALAVAWNAFTSAISTGWNAVVQPVWAAMQAVGSALGTALSAVWAGIKVAWDAVSSAIQVAWTSVIQPVWDAIVVAAKVLLAVVATLVLTPILIAWNLLSATIQATWTGIIQPAWQAMQALAQVMWTGVIQPIWAAMKAAWDALAIGLKIAYDTIIAPTWQAMQALWNTLAAFFTTAWAALSALWTVTWNAISAFFQSIWNAISAFAQSIWNAISAFFTAGWAAYTAGWQAFWNAISAFFQSIWNAISAFAQSIWNAISAFFTAGWAAYTAGWQIFWNAVSTFFQQIWNAISAFAQAIWNAISAFFTAGWAAYTAGWQAFWNAISAFFQQIWNAISAFAQAIWNVMQAAWSVFTSVFRATYDAFAGPLSTAWGALWGGIQTAAQAVWGALQTAWSAVTGAIRAVFDAFAGPLSTAWSALWNGLKTVADTIWGGIKAAIDVPIKFLVNTVLIGGLFTAWNAVANALGLGNLAINMAPITGFATGGYTGETGLFGTTGPDDPAGVVHAKEFVFTANQVANAGGPDAMYALAGQLDNGYAMGGLVRKNAGDPQPMLNSYVVPPDVAPRLSRFLDALSHGQAEAVQAAGGFDAIGPGFFWGGYADAVTAAKAFANTAVGKPYVWGGVGPNGYDCSGIQSAVTNVLQGSTAPYSRRGTTADFPWAGFSTGLGDYTIGSTPNYANSGTGHMASTLAGLNIESAGGVGVRTGSAAWGALHSGFTTQAFLSALGTANPPVAGASGGGQPSALTILGQVVSTAADVAALLGSSIASGVAHLAGMVSGNSKFEQLITAVPDHLRNMLWDKVKDQVGTLIGTLLGGTGTPTPITGQGGSVADEAYLIAQSGFGWGTQADKDALNYIATHESNWTPTAQNPTSSASGIWQLIDSTWDAYRLAKDTSYAHARLAPSADQDWAGFGYIKARYGNPIAAQQYWAAHGNYDTGGWLPPGATNVINGTGGFEAVLNRAQQAAVVQAVDNPQGNDYHHVQVFLGDKEITDLIDMRVAHQSSRDGRTIRSSR